MKLLLRAMAIGLGVLIVIAILTVIMSLLVVFAFQSWTDFIITISSVIFVVFTYIAYKDLKEKESAIHNELDNCDEKDAEAL